VGADNLQSAIGNLQYLDIRIFQPVFRLGSVIGIVPGGFSVKSLLPALPVLAPATFPGGTSVLMELVV
jgi:hypothetical protein